MTTSPLKLDIATGRLTCFGSMIAQRDMTISVALQHPARRTDREVSVPNPNHNPVFSQVFFSFYDGGGGWEFRDEKLDAVSFMLRLPQDTGDWSDLEFDAERRKLHDEWCCSVAGSNGASPMGRGPDCPRLWFFPWGYLASYLSCHSNGAAIRVAYGAEERKEPFALARYRTFI